MPQALARRTRLAVLGGSLLALASAPGCLGLFAAAALANSIPCDGQFIDQLDSDQGLSDECRAELKPYLPDPEDNFAGRVITLGSQSDAGENLVVYFHGADVTGVAYDATDYAGAVVVVTAEDGGTVELSATDLAIGAVDDTHDLVSLALVNDYSASMLDHDLDSVEAIETEAVNNLPDSTEASVTDFSDDVLEKQAFTEDRDLLTAAVKRDDGFERDMTALYDGMGSALDELTMRDRPIRILMVSSDGQENASTQTDKQELLDTIRNEDVTVVVLAALFADLPEVENLTQNDGVFFYTPFYADMDALAGDYLASLETIYQLTIPAEYLTAPSIELQIDGETVADLTPAG